MNGKVRIYDLSKELNLENKDILEICDQINISVKSHSSTITESEAERIRAAAKKYTPTKKENSLGTSSEGSRKQEILAIHHKNEGKEQTIESQKSDAPKLIGPPSRPQAKVEQKATPKKEQENGLRSPKPPKLKDSPKPQNVVKAKPANPPEFIREKPSEQVQNTAIIEPPSRAKTGDKKQPKKQIKKPETKKEGTIEKEKINKVIPKIVKETEALGEKPKAKKLEEIELKRPLRTKPVKEIQPEEDEELLVKAQQVVEEDDFDSDDLNELSKPKPKLKRPTHPHKGKNKWEEEEDTDPDEVKGKLSKTAKTSKRRSLVIEDDDLEEILEDEDLATPVMASLSLARPPKPKSLSNSKPKAEATKTQKPTAKTESNTSKNNKTERREKQTVEERPETVVFSGNLTVREISDLLKVPETEIIKNLFSKGIAVNITQTLDLDIAKTIAEDLGVKVETEKEKAAAAAKTTEILDEKDLENLKRRPPVVTIMGHVDHGKTTLLDSIRNTKVVQGEAGGITQHIGAYHVDVEHDGKTEQVVFLDTPGHEAFTAMRARGTRVTDIAVLVVAADDGVQPQTREAISHARAAEVPIVVAINKIDKPEANPDRIKQELMELQLVPEEWGGETIMVPVSALKGQNLDDLLEMILLVAEVEDLYANPDRPAKGTVIEANLDRTKGPVATLIVQNGTLKVGDTIVAGAVLGKIRAMIDDRGNKVEAATPSFAVEVLGLNDVPAAGDEFDVFENEKDARAVAQERADAKRETRLQQAMSSRRISLSNLSAQAQAGELKELNLILKADVQGSVEAILGALKELPQKEVQIRVLLAAPGEITETDVDLAAASGAVIVGFNTTLATGARAAADQEGVDIREYNIIYKLLDDIQAAMEGLLDPEEVESSLGTAEVRAIFTIGRGAVAGCYVQSGKIVRNRLLRVRRKGEIIFTGVLDSLKRVKEDAREVNAGFECGIGSSKFTDWQEGDIIECYEMILKRRTLSPK